MIDYIYIVTTKNGLEVTRDRRGFLMRAIVTRWGKRKGYKLKVINAKTNRTASITKALQQEGI